MVDDARQYPQAAHGHPPRELNSDFVVGQISHLEALDLQYNSRQFLWRNCDEFFTQLPITARWRS